MSISNRSLAPPAGAVTFNELEPPTFEEYIGQEKAKEMAQILVNAANQEERMIPNTLLTGTAGLGKTTLAKLMLKDDVCVFIDGNAFNTVYNNLWGNVIIDEIHNVKPDICDSLNVFLDTDRLSVIGCTTNPGMLPAALRSRLRMINLVPYTEQNLLDILRNVIVRKNKDPIGDDLLMEIAKRSRRTPRRAIQYLSFILDMMVVNNVTTLSRDLLMESFDKLGLDSVGLLDIDHKYLSVFPEDGRPVGIQYLSARIAVDRETIEEEIEPYLMELGLVDRTAKGRKRL